MEPQFSQFMVVWKQKKNVEIWIKNTLSREITEFDLHVISTCEWLFLNKMTNDNTPSILQNTGIK